MPAWLHDFIFLISEKDEQNTTETTVQLLVGYHRFIISLITNPEEDI